jgi:hypothetical protein
MPGTVFQYWRVTLPVAGAQDDADAVLDGAGDEQAASTATPVTAATATPAKRTRVTELLMASY